MIDARVGPSVEIGNAGDPGGMALGEMIDQVRGENGAASFKQIYATLFSEHAGRLGRDTVAEAAETPLEVAAEELVSLAIDTQAISEELKQPVLWLTVDGADQEAIGRAFQNVQFGQVVGSGHFPHLEVPEQTNAMIERFVSIL